MPIITRIRVIAELTDKIEKYKYKCMSKRNISVIGGGSWGTVLANLAAKNNHKALLWMRDSELCKEINSHKINSKYLPKYTLEEGLMATNDISAIKDSNVVIYCVPSDSLREVLLSSSQFLKNDAYIISATKGVEPGSFFLMSQIIEKETDSHFKVGVLSGPNLAGEIAEEHLTGTVIASKHQDLSEDIVRIYQTPFFKVYVNSDPYGVELGGALKNIYALACGIAFGLNAGENTIGMIMTRGLGEMSRLAHKLGADPMTFLGLSGVGDLITTCASPLSRNHKMGELIGKGNSLEESKRIVGQAVEGIKTLEAVKKKSDEVEISMPIVDSLYRVIIKGESLDSVQKILGNDQPKDVEFFK